MMNYLEWLTWNEKALVLAHRFGCFTPASIHPIALVLEEDNESRWEHATEQNHSKEMSVGEVPISFKGMPPLT